MNTEHVQHDTEGREQKLAAALGALTRQIDINDYRDSHGHDLKMNTAYIHAQAIVDEFGVSHEDICKVLDSCGDDMGKAAARLRALASPLPDGVLPEEPGTWVAEP